MSICVVTAAFRAKYMDRVAESVKSQTYQPAEWIIVNDGQQEIRDWYKANKGSLPLYTWMIDVERPRGRFGLYSRNLGAMATHCSHIAFLDDDNFWTEDHLESLVEVYRGSGGKVPFCWMDQRGKKPGSTWRKIKRTGFSKQGIDLGCLLWPRDAMEKFGYFRNDAQVTFDFNAIKRVYDGLGHDQFVSTNKATLIFMHKRY